jgi:hypothetical protein
MTLIRSRNSTSELRILTSQGVPVIDRIDGLKDHGPENTLWVTPADDHPNGKANALIAQQLREWF